MHGRLSREKRARLKTLGFVNIFGGFATVAAPARYLLKIFSYISLAEARSRISNETRMSSVITAHKNEPDCLIFMVPE